MSPEQKKEFRIGYLSKMILYHKKKYYSGNAIINDQAYDSLEDELAVLDPENPILSMVGPGTTEFEEQETNKE
jgi:NAD-dependent DNA ligase